jgi:2-keto-3-deoxy-L-rhamnonate aldolase RhmA
MRKLIVAGVALLLVPGTQAPAQRLNPVVDLLSAGKPVFGLYAPANRRAGGGRPGAPGGPGGAGAGAAQPAQAATPAPAPKSPDELAAEALAHTTTDYIFDGSMEGNFDRGYETFSTFVAGMAKGGALSKKPARLHHPLFVKMTEIGTDHALAGERIARQLNLGVSGIVFVKVESAEEVKAGLAAMRFKSKGGTRPDDVGGAPAYWGMSEKDYKAKADVWPLNKNGELTNFVIVESKAGLEKVREIAAVPGVGVLFPGAGTLRGVFSSTDSTGRRIPDPVAWEAAIQQVLAACKEFKVPCGYPAGENDIEERMRQGFSVFVIGWGDAGNRAVEKGRAFGKR